ncbi:hypothetical protein J6590_081216 [Homalodisca vitripennis]|nr:hypothetical protein J6590_081216 [Homalodisca vitripennis]
MERRPEERNGSPDYCYSFVASDCGISIMPVAPAWPRTTQNVPLRGGRADILARTQISTMCQQRSPNRQAESLLYSVSSVDSCVLTMSFKLSSPVFTILGDNHNRYFRIPEADY